jgi:hypothetical protein
MAHLHLDRSLSLALISILGAALGGCREVGAPSFEFFGAFFPAWLLCSLAGIVGAAGARAALASPRLIGSVPYLLAVCTAVGVLIAVAMWLLLFR